METVFGLHFRSALKNRTSRLTTEKMVSKIPQIEILSAVRSLRNLNVLVYQIPFWRILLETR